MIAKIHTDHIQQALSDLAESGGPAEMGICENCFEDLGDFLNHALSKIDLDGPTTVLIGVCLGVRACQISIGENN